jgi:hypothetical protein
MGEATVSRASARRGRLTCGVVYGSPYMLAQPARSRAETSTIVEYGTRYALRQCVLTRRLQCTDLGRGTREWGCGAAEESMPHWHPSGMSQKGDSDRWANGRKARQAGVQGLPFFAPEGVIGLPFRPF